MLLAFLWDPDRSALLLKQLGYSREQVRARLAERGVDLPQPQLPSPDPRRWGPKVDVPLDELWIHLRKLPYVLPPSAQVGFNHDSKSGWIIATEGVDLPEYIERAGAASAVGRLTPNDCESRTRLTY